MKNLSFTCIFVLVSILFTQNSFGMDSVRVNILGYNLGRTKFKLRVNNDWYEFHTHRGLNAIAFWVYTPDSFVSGDLLNFAILKSCGFGKYKSAIREIRFENGIKQCILLHRPHSYGKDFFQTFWTNGALPIPHVSSKFWENPIDTIFRPTRIPASKFVVYQDSNFSRLIKSGIKIFPTSGKNVLTIKLPDTSINMTCTLINQSVNSTVFSSRIQSKFEIPTKHLSSGEYQLILLSNQYRYVIRFRK